MTMTRIACLLMTLLATAQGGADEWRMLDESEFLFEASWEGTTLPGRITAFDVRLEIDDGGFATARLVVTVDLAGADMDDPDINEAIAGDEWFGVAEYPQATYTSRSIVETAPDEYRAVGELELKGISQSVEVPFTWTESAGRAEMSGEFVLDRTQFNIGSGEWANDESIGTAVRLSFKVLFLQQ